MLVSVGDIKMSNLRLLFASFATTTSLWKMWKVGHGLKRSKVPARLEEATGLVLKITACQTPTATFDG